MQYLVEEGIEPKRLTAKGYGEFRPLISDQKIKKMKTEEKKETAHMTNKRIEFTIASVEYGK